MDLSVEKIPENARPFADNIPYDMNIILETANVISTGEAHSIPRKYELEVMRS